jgi:TPP-dependent 2-oxoacid decarboxylase
MNTTTTTVAGYLLTRLNQAGIRTVFGVPGDYNLPLLDAVGAATPTMAWAGTATEQGAAYAADSYARLRGLGAVITTFGVGELSAINAIAGAYAESVPVVHIVGTPALRARQGHLTLHHNLPDNDFGHFARMAAEVTAAQASLRPETAPAEIDRVLGVALATSRPVYLAIPADVATMTVPAPAGPLAAAGQGAAPEMVAGFAAHAGRVLRTARSASLLIGHLAARFGVTAQLGELAAAGQLPVAVLSPAKGDFPEASPLFAGLYAGVASAKRARIAVEEPDVLITAGVTLADLVTPGAELPPDDRRIDLTPGRACVAGVVYPGVTLRQSVAALLTEVRATRPERLALDAAPEPVTVPAPHPASRLTQPLLWSAVQEFLRPGDVVIAGQGTAFYGATGLTLPDGAHLMGQPMWASPGWALPAALGATFAAWDRRVVLIIGDGAMQQAAAELGTLLALGLAPVIIVVNNGGYTTERAIAGPSAAYHDIPALEWTALASAMGKAGPSVSLRAVNAGQLDDALAAAALGTGDLVLIEAVLPAEDVPPLLRDLTRRLAA